MIIHTVSSGETLNDIAYRYGVSPESIIINNSLDDPSRLTVGQTLVILYYSITYTVAAGDTLESIAERYSVPLSQLWRNNPSLGGGVGIYPDQTIVISYQAERRGELETNGYIYPFVSESTLRRTLPYLTYVTVFSYGFDREGRLIYPDDERALEIISEYDVKPIMLLTTLGDDGSFSNELSAYLFGNAELRDVLIDNVIAAMSEKGYYGLDIDFEYVFPEDAAVFAEFVRGVRERLEPLGYPVLVALAPKNSAEQSGLLYEGHDYRALGEVADSVLLMTYEWGYTYGPPMAVAPLNKVTEVVDYAISEIPGDRIFLGMPNYGYLWNLPYVKGESRAETISNVEAVDIADANGAEIEYDDVAAAPFFGYFSGGGEYEAWFEDARSVEAKLTLAGARGLRGISFWNLMNWFPQSWLVINALYNIVKL